MGVDRAQPSRSTAEVLSRLGWLGLSVICVILPRQAEAIDRYCPVREGAEAALGEHPAEQRLAWVRTRLQTEALRTQTWGFGWLYGYTGLAAAGLAVAGVFGSTGSSANAVDNVIDAGASLVGAAFTLVTWLPAGADAQALEVRLRTARSGDTCTLLAEAEGMLEREASAEAQGRAWYTHVLLIAFNVGLAGLLGVGLHHWLDAGLDLVGGTAISEAQVFTQPVGAREALREYRLGELGAAHTTGVRWSLGPLLGPSMGGLVLHGEL